MLELGFDFIVFLKKIKDELDLAIFTPILTR
mgnify:CR=1 FL=1